MVVPEATDDIPSLASVNFHGTIVTPKANGPEAIEGLRFEVVCSINLGLLALHTVW